MQSSYFVFYKTLKCCVFKCIKYINDWHNICELKVIRHNIIFVTYKGKCLCDDGLGGADCSLDLSKGPTIAGLLDNGLCDEQQLDCDHAYVFGQIFTDSNNLSCKLDEFMVWFIR